MAKRRKKPPTKKERRELYIQALRSDRRQELLDKLDPQKAKPKEEPLSLLRLKH